MGHQSGEGRGWGIQSGEGRGDAYGRPLQAMQLQSLRYSSLSLPLLSPSPPNLPPPGDDAAPKFTINSVTGLIQTSSNPLDRETRDAYTLTVIATDSGIPQNTVSSCAQGVLDGASPQRWGNMGTRVPMVV